MPECSCKNDEPYDPAVYVTLVFKFDNPSEFAISYQDVLDNMGAYGTLVGAKARFPKQEVSLDVP